MQQVQVCLDAQLLQGAGEAGGAQVQGPLLHVLPRGQHLIRGQLAGDHPGVAGGLPEPAHVRLAAGGLLPLLGRFGVEFQDQLVRGVPDLAERHPGRGPGQHLVGPGGVGVAEDAGLLLDDPQVHRVDPARGQRGERGRQPPGHRGRVVHLLGRGLRAQVQLKAQLDRGELIGRPGPGVPGRVGGDGGQLRPRRAGGQPPGRRDDPQQLIIGTPRQALAVLAGDRIDDGGHCSDISSSCGKPPLLPMPPRI